MTRSVPPRPVPCLLALALGFAPAGAATAQVLQGAWVTESQKSIETHRKVEVRVLVLDVEGRPVPRAAVHLAQRRHAFTFGLVLGPAGLPASLAEGRAEELPVWRCFNGIALGPRDTGDGQIHPSAARAPTALPPATEVRAGATSTPQGPESRPAAATAPDAAEPGEPAHPPEGMSPAAAVLMFARMNGWEARWGGVFSASPREQPAAISAVADADAAAYILAYAKGAALVEGGDATQFDLYTRVGDGSYFEDRFGVALLRRAFETARAANPRALYCLRFEDPLPPERLQAMLARVTSLREAFVPFDAVAVETRFGGTLVQAPLARSLEWVTRMKTPVIVSRLEVGGSTEAAAALNLETLLRTLFGNPGIRGVWFGGAAAGDLADPSAALVDEAGRATPAGTVLDRMVRTLWWTDTEAACDELGGLQARVFAGLYDLTADLPDGARARTTVFLPPDRPERVIVLQPLKPGVEGPPRE